jgi:hypothetical protein
MIVSAWGKPPASLGGGTGRESAGDLEVAHGGVDVPAHGGNAHVHAVRDRVVLESDGHHVQHALLDGGEGAMRLWLARADGGGAFPEPLEVVPHSEGDGGSADEQRPAGSSGCQREQRGGLVGKLHLHGDGGQYAYFLPGVDALLEVPGRDRVLGSGHVVDGPDSQVLAHG